MNKSKQVKIKMLVLAPDAKVLIKELLFFVISLCHDEYEIKTVVGWSTSDIFKRKSKLNFAERSCFSEELIKKIFVAQNIFDFEFLNLENTPGDHLNVQIQKRLRRVFQESKPDVLVFSENSRSSKSNIRFNDEIWKNAIRYCPKQIVNPFEPVRTEIGKEQFNVSVLNKVRLILSDKMQENFDLNILERYSYISINSSGASYL